MTFSVYLPLQQECSGFKNNHFVLDLIVLNLEGICYPVVAVVGTDISIHYKSTVPHLISMMLSTTTTMI